MKKATANEQLLAALLRQDNDPGRKQKLSAVWRFSVPAILAQLTSIMMQYIDTAMVGSLGAGASAAIGVVSTSTWLLNGLCSAVSTGFSVQAAQKIGAGQDKEARQVMHPHPVVVSEDTLAAAALRLMQENKVTSLFVTNDGKPVGILNVHDCLRAGVE